MRGKGLLRLLVSAVVIACAVLVAVMGFGEKGIGSVHNVKLGLDLAGGVSITYQTVKEDPTSEEMDDTVYKMQRRAESFSTEAEVAPEGSDRIMVAIPSVTDADEVLAELGSAGNIYFIYGKSNKGIANIEAYIDTTTGETKYKLTRSMEEIIADGDVVIDGSDIAGANPNAYQDNFNIQQNIVELTLNDSGRVKFATATEYAYSYRSTDRDIRNLIAIVYDNEVINAPGVADVISDGKAQISGQKTYDEAKKLASTIRIGALPLELSVLRYYVEGAQLGADALNTSLIAGIIGFALVVIFMIVMYRIPGVAASIALVFYVALMIISLNLFNVTLTLPGIAGIILSIGMAVDANVIIFTRIQEETATGKTVRSAIKLGFHKALSAIIDGNVTTILAAIILYFIGSGTVKGFAKTLAIGIVLSMITALFITKFLLSSLYELGFSDVKYYGTKKERKTFHVAENFKKFICISGGVILVGVIAVIINFATIKTPFNYGLEFEGGTATSVVFDGELPSGIQTDVEALVSSTIGQTATVSTVASENMVTIKTKELSTEDRAKLATALKDKFGIENSRITTDSVGAVVSGEMKRDAIVAVIVATIGMLLYIWIRFKNINFAASAVLALIHDVLVVLTLYAVGRHFISVGNTFIACMLTIVGYSINATIVIFDRIRENMNTKTKKDSVMDVVNASITQTLSRSINTSLTTFFMVAVLAVMGVSSVKEFAIPLIAGIICGTFSSVCITGGLWYTLQRKFKKSEE